MAGHTRATLDSVSLTSVAEVAPAPSTDAATALALRSEAAAPRARDAAAGRGVVRRLLAFDEGGSPLTFYAALRRLECRFRERPRVGEAGVPSDEPVRLTQAPSLGFRVTALAGVADGRTGEPARVAVSFLGAFGPHGPLPLHLTEYAQDRKRHHGDGSLIGFLDIFHHRLLSLLYRAWADAQPTVSHDRLDDDKFARRFGALVGLGPASPPRTLSQVDYACLHSAGHFVGQTRHAEGLAKVLKASFGVAVDVEEFVGQWMSLPEEGRWRLPVGAPSPRAGVGVLGESARLGTEIWDQQSTFRVIVGPLGHAQYQRFLPGGEHLARLVELVERYAGPELRWDLRLVLREPERRCAVLGVEGVMGMTAHLADGNGQVSPRHEDLVLDPSSIRR